LAAVTFLCGCLPFTVLWLLSPFTALAVGTVIVALQVALALHVQGAINCLEGAPQAAGNARLTGISWVGITMAMLGWGAVLAWMSRGLALQ
jgi:hypothetical protein